MSSLYQVAKENNLTEYARLISNLRRAVRNYVVDYITEELEVDEECLRTAYEYLNYEVKDVLDKCFCIQYIIDGYESFNLTVNIDDERIYDLDDFSTDDFILEKTSEYNYDFSFKLKSKGQVVIERI